MLCAVKLLGVLQLWRALVNGETLDRFCTALLRTHMLPYMQLHLHGAKWDTLFLMLLQVITAVEGKAGGEAETGQVMVVVRTFLQTTMEFVEENFPPQTGGASQILPYLPSLVTLLERAGDKRAATQVSATYGL